MSELEVNNKPKRSDSIAELAKALVLAQGEMKGAIRDSSNPFFKSTYADLSSVWDACRVPLTKNGLAVIQCPRGTAEGIEIETILVHSSGEWISETLSIPVPKRDAQSMGSAITYARRYALSSFVGIAPEDDDGNKASEPVADKKSKLQGRRSEPVLTDIDQTAMTYVSDDPFGPGVTEIVEKGKEQKKQSFDVEIDQKKAELKEIMTLPCFTDDQRTVMADNSAKCKTLEGITKLVSRAMDHARKNTKAQAKADREANLQAQLEISQEGVSGQE